MTAAFDSADYLTDPVALRTYLQEAITSGDGVFLAHAAGVAVRALSTLGALDSFLDSRTDLTTLRVVGLPDGHAQASLLMPSGGYRVCVEPTPSAAILKVLRGPLAPVPTA